MENFTFYNPVNIIFGKDTIKLIGEQIANAGISTVLLLAGGGSIRHNGVYDEVIASLKRHDIRHVEVWGVRPNPTLKHAQEAILQARERNCEAILAIGGGSVIDEAKAISAGFYLDDTWSLYTNKPKIHNALPIFTVLTISGTASEFNCFSVLSNDDEKKKWAFNDKLIFPKVSIINPEVQMSLPWEQTANGAFDTMAHAMEFYFRANGSEETSISFIESILNSVIKNVDILKRDITNYEARANISWAATLALSGLTAAGLNGGVWASHRIEHAVSAVYPCIYHGAGLAVIFPEWIKYAQDANPALFARWAKKIWGAPNVDSALEKMKKKLKSWKMKTKLSELGVERDKLDEIAENAANMPGGFKTVKPLEIDDIKNILNAAF